MPTLSRGESQRARLAVVLANRLEDLLHVLDEPTIGLHHRDVAPCHRRRWDGLRGPVLMVEHDTAAVAHADQVVTGPGRRAGRAGELVFHGPPATLWARDTASGALLRRTREGVGRRPRPTVPDVAAPSARQPRTGSSAGSRSAA